MDGRVSTSALRTALLCGALALAGACGDDDDDGGDKGLTDAGGDAGSKPDGGGAIDGGGAPIDGGGKLDGGAGPIVVPDASTDELTEALDRTGVKVSSRRADLLFPLACKHGVECLTEENTQECVTDVRAGYDKGVAANYDQNCLDATLDLYSCFAQVPCERYMTDCTPLMTIQGNFCAKYASTTP